MVSNSYDTTKNSMGYIMKITMLFLFVLTMSSCQTLKTIGENPNYDMLDLFRGSKSFDLSAPFPKNGYKLRGITYRNVEIQKLGPAATPEAVFTDMEPDDSRYRAYSFCNIHGLWTSEK